MSCRWDWTNKLRAAMAMAALALSAASSARADVKLPNVFGSHMVLQQGQKNKVWGLADPNESIVVTIGSQKQTATANEKGSWEVWLEPLSVGGPLSMTVAGKNKITFDDVLVGEVWICSGQSNMQWDVNASNDADLERATAHYPKIRLLSVPQVGTQEPQWNFEGKWTVCTPETVGSFSAVGYFFGRQLHQTIGVPIGLIDNAWGGSAAEAWINRERLAADSKYKPLLERWEQIEKNVDKNRADWANAVAKAKAEKKQLPRNPDEVLRGNARPANIYNGVLKPTIGYGIRGVIWYQGESNAGRAYQYRHLFPLMITNWREEWGQGDFPFYWVQLADFLAEKSEPGESAWAELREAQTMTEKKLPNTGQAVIIDLGEAKDIHPRNKQGVATRLARLALSDVYGVKNIATRSPAFKAMKKDGKKVVLTFDHVDGGFRPFDVNELKGFTIAGSDRKFVNANAKVTGPNTIEVWSDSVNDPQAVRYGWADNPIVNVYSNAGLPLTPFRTDDWPGVTAEAH